MIEELRYDFNERVGAIRSSGDHKGEAEKPDRERSRMAPGAVESGKIASADKALIVTVKTHEAIAELALQLRYGLNDIRKYIGDIPEHMIGGKDWDAILSFLNVMNGVHAFMRRESTKLANAIEDVQNGKGAL